MSVPSISSSSGIRDNHNRGSVGDFLREELKAGADLDIVTAYFQQKLAAGLQGRRDFVLSLADEQPQEDNTTSELVTWLVLHEGAPVTA